MFNRVLIDMTLVLALFSSPSAADDDIGALLRWIPEDANIVVIMNFDEILRSDLATRERWAEKPPNDLVSKPLIVPPHASLFILASKQDFGNIRTFWDIGIFHSKTSPSMATIAHERDGRLDTIAERKAVWTPLELYFVELAPQVTGVYFPANRQQTTRWVRSGAARSTEVLTPYLRDAARSVGSTDVLAAMDLDGAADPSWLREDLNIYASLAGQTFDLDDVAQTLASIRGLVMSIEIGSAPRGMVRVQFKRSLKKMQSVIGPLVLEYMGTFGADQLFEGWEATLEPDGLAVALQGPVSEFTMRTLAGLIEVPGPEDDVRSTGASSARTTPDATRKEPPVAGANDSDNSDMDPTARASLAHFRAVGELLEDIEKRSQKITFSDVTWMRRYARNIDRLPILNVDQDLQGYTASVAERLRESANVMEEHRQTVRQRNAKQVGDNRYRQYAHGYRYYGRGRSRSPRYNVMPGADQRKRQQFEEEEKSEGVKLVIEILKSIQDDSALVRKDMTNRYSVEF